MAHGKYRYGTVLQSQELNHFEPLRSSDFEVDHWLRHFAAQNMAAAEQAADPRCGCQAPA